MSTSSFDFDSEKCGGGAAIGGAMEATEGLETTGDLADSGAGLGVAD